MLRYLEDFLEAQEINKKDICIVGSFALEIAGIRKANDIDIILKKEDRIALEIPLNKAIKVNDKIEIVTCGWSEFLGITDDELIDNIKYHNYIFGYKIVKLDLIKKKKKYSKRKKDLKDLILLGSMIKLKNIKNKYSNLNTIKSYCIKWLRKIKYFLKIIYKPCSNLFKHKIIYDLFCKEFILCIPPEVLISTEYNQKVFSRYDIIVRYIAIENYIKKEKDPFYLYNKMQNKRTKSSIDYEEKIKSLIFSFQNTGYKLNSVITISQDGHLVDGSHRIAAALFFNIPLVRTNISYKRKGIVQYGIDWFSKNGFSKDECDFLRIKRNLLFYRKGLFFYVLLWPTVFPYFNEIKSKISEQYRIISSKIFFYNEEEFKNSFYKIYEIDDIEKWKINKKYHAMKKYKKNVMLILVEFSNPKYRKKNLNNSYISTIGEKLKQKIRNDYKHKIDGYIYDIICHTGDNYEHNRNILKIFNNNKIYKI